MKNSNLVRYRKLGGRLNYLRGKLQDAQKVEHVRYYETKHAQHQFKQGMIPPTTLELLVNRLQEASNARQSLEETISLTMLQQQKAWASMNEEEKKKTRQIEQN